ncbi:MAG: hypothetical protein E5X58_37355, partial [Mesorhizobium sp.]
MGKRRPGDNDVAETAGKPSTPAPAFANGPMKKRQGNKTDDRPDKHAAKQERRNPWGKPKGAKHDENDGRTCDKEGSHAIGQPGYDGGEVGDEASHYQAETGPAGYRRQREELLDQQSADLTHIVQCKSCPLSALHHPECEERYAERKAGHDQPPLT